MENVQKRLKAYRLQQGLTQTEISEKLGMKQATYQKLESGKTPDMRISTLFHICKTLDVSADWLLGLEPSKKPKYYELIVPEGSVISEEEAIAINKWLNALKAKVNKD